MASQLAEAIHQLIQDKGLTEEAVLKTVENTIKAAYKRAYGTSDNCYVEFEDDLSDVSVYSRKMIVDGVYDPVTEIELEDALKMSPDCEVGDEIDILIDPRDFELSAVQTGKQTAHQALSEIQKDTLMAEYKDKVGEIIVGYYQRERNGNIYVNLGNVEGILPVKFQSPREVYHKNDRIRALVVDVKKRIRVCRWCCPAPIPNWYARSSNWKFPKFTIIRSRFLRLSAKPATARKSRFFRTAKTLTRSVLASA